MVWKPASNCERNYWSPSWTNGAKNQHSPQKQNLQSKNQTSPITSITSNVSDNFSFISDTDNQVKITESEGYLNNDNKPINFKNSKTTIVTLKPDGRIIAS